MVRQGPGRIPLLQSSSQPGSVHVPWTPTPFTSRQTLAPGPLQPCNLPWQDTANTSAGQNKPWEAPGPWPSLPTGQHSLWAPQPVVLGSSPTHQRADTSFRTPQGPVTRDHWAPAPATSRPTPVMRHIGLFSQPPQDLSPITSGLASALGHPGNCSHLCQEPALPTSRSTLDLGTVASQPPTLEPGCAHQCASTSPRTPLGFCS